MNFKKLLPLLGLMGLTTVVKSQSWNRTFQTYSTGERVNLAEGKRGEVYLGYRDFQKGKANVRKYENGIWSLVGDSAFTPEWIGTMKLEVADDSMPVVAVTDINKKYQITVMKFNGTKWDTVGRRGFTTFTSSGEIGLACGGGKMFVAFQIYNQIKVWYWDKANQIWDVVGSGGIASTGFPSGCELTVINDKLYVAYRDNSGVNVVRYTDASTASSSSNWVTLSSSFGSGQSGNIRVTPVLGYIHASNIKSSDNTFENWLKTGSSFSAMASLPYNLSAFDICQGYSDTFPLLAINDSKSYGRVFRGNSQYKWDSVGTVFTTDKITGTPAIIYTKSHNLFVAYQVTSNSKVEVMQFCAPVTSGSVMYGGNAVYCKKSGKNISVKQGLATVRWYRNDTLISGETNATLHVAKPGTYKACLKNNCGDSAFSSAATFTESVLAKPVVVVGASSLSANATFPFYMWQYQGADISGAVSQTYTPTQSGSYRLIVGNTDFCTDTSDAVNFWMAGVSSPVPAGYAVYPNPASNQLHWNVRNEGSVQLTDLGGRILMTASIADGSIDLSPLANGIYLVRFEGLAQTQRIVKQ